MRMNLYDMYSGFNTKEAQKRNILAVSLKNGLCIPNERFYRTVGRHAVKEGLLIKGMTEYEFERLRFHVNTVIRREKRPAAKLISVYELLSLVCTKNAEYMAEFEYKEFMKYTVLNPFVLRFIRKYLEQGKRVYLVNDAMLTDEEMNRFLTANRLSDLIKHKSLSIVHWSNEYINFEDFIFEKADYKNVIYLGKCGKMQVNRAADILRYDMGCGDRFYRETVYYGERNILTNIRQILSLFRQRRMNSIDDAGYEFGLTVVGPLVTLFAEWILNIAQYNHIDQIYPLMRDGYIMGKVLQELCIKRGIDTVKIVPLYTSRRAMFHADVTVDAEAFVDNEIHRNPKMTVGALYGNLNLANPFEQYDDLFLSDCRQIGSDSEDKTVFDEIVRHLNRNMEKIEQKKDEMCGTIFRYLEQTIRTEDRFITVDFGFAGTIGNSINRVLKKYGRRTDHIHLLMCGSARECANIFEGTLIRGFLYDCGQGSEVFRYSSFLYSIIENCMMGPQGTTLGYRMSCNEEKAEPFIANETTVNMELNRVCHEGIMDFTEFWTRLTEMNPGITELVSDEKECLKTIIECSLLYPGQSEANFCSNISSDNIYLKTGLTRNICSEETFKIAERIQYGDYLNVERKNKLDWIAGACEILFPGSSFLQLVKNSENYKNTDYRVMLSIVTYALRLGLKETAIYGVGVKGRILYEMLMAVGIKTTVFIDRSLAFRDRCFDEVNIIMPNEITGWNLENICIASVIYQNEIEKNLKKLAGDKVRIITADSMNEQG